MKACVKEAIYFRLKGRIQKKTWNRPVHRRELQKQTARKEQQNTCTINKHRRLYFLQSTTYLGICHDYIWNY